MTSNPTDYPEYSILSWCQVGGSATWIQSLNRHLAWLNLEANIWNSVQCLSKLIPFLQNWIFLSNFQIELVSTNRTLRKICWLVSPRTELNNQKLHANFYLICCCKVEHSHWIFWLSCRLYQSLTLPLSEIHYLSLVVVRTKPLSDKHREKNSFFFFLAKANTYFIVNIIATA